MVASDTRSDAILKILKRTKNGFTPTQVHERLIKAGRDPEVDTLKRTTASLSGLKRRGVVTNDEQSRWTLTS